MTRANQLAVVRLRARRRAAGLARHARLTGLAGDGDAIPVVARVADDEDRDASGAGWGYPGCLHWWQPVLCYRRGGDDGVGDVLDVEGGCYCWLLRAVVVASVTLLWAAPSKSGSVASISRARIDRSPCIKTLCTHDESNSGAIKDAQDAPRTSPVAARDLRSHGSRSSRFHSLSLLSMHCRHCAAACSATAHAPRIIEITPPASALGVDSDGQRPRASPSSTRRSDRVLDLTTDDDARAAETTRARATPYAFSPQRAATPTPSLADDEADDSPGRGLGVMDLVEKSIVEAATPKPRRALAEAARLEARRPTAGRRRPRPKARVRAGRRRQPRAPDARRHFGVRTTPGTAVRVERNVAASKACILSRGFHSASSSSFDEMKGSTADFDGNRRALPARRRHEEAVDEDGQTADDGG